MRLPCVSFLQIRTIVRRHWAASLDCRTDEIFFPPHRAYQALPEKQTGRHAGAQAPGRRLGRFLPRSDDIPIDPSGFGKSQPPDCVPPREAVPDILHGSYLLTGAISRFIAYARFGHNLPARLIRIAKFPLDVKREFCIFYRFFELIFVQNRDCGFPPVVAQNVGEFSACRQSLVDTLRQVFRTTKRNEMFEKLVD